MGKQHFDLFTFVARALICRRCCNAPSHIASGFMDAASDLAERSVRAALGFHRTRRTVCLSGSEDDGVGFRDVRTLVLEGSPFATQWVAGRAAVFLSLFIPVEIVTRKAVVLTLGFVPHRHMRLDVFFLHHPGQHRRGTVTVPSCCVIPLRPMKRFCRRPVRGATFSTKSARSSQLDVSRKPGAIQSACWIRTSFNPSSGSGAALRTGPIGLGRRLRVNRTYIVPLVLPLSPSLRIHDNGVFFHC